MTTNDEAPWEASLRECLAYAVLEDYESWLGVPSPHGLSVFLAGARTRADLARQPLSTWRLSGPLDEPDFYLPLVARTGHPQLAIKWATAMEMLHFSPADAMRELRDLTRTRARERGEPAKADDRFPRSESAEDLFRSMAAPS